MIKESDMREYKKPVIDLMGTQGNAFAILGIAKNVHRDLKRQGIELPDFKVIQSEMMASNYNNLINIFDKYFGDYVDLQK